jgi:sulfate/thiosulfate transport system substrate-binding protein
MNKEKKKLSRIVARLGIAGIALAATLGIAACGDDDDDGSSGGGGNVGLVAYSTPQQAYEEGLIPAFEDTPDANGVEFTTSFGSSGDQSRAVEAGQDADYVSFSIEPDMQRLVDAGLVGPDWNKAKYEGNVTDSVVVFMVRPGNPEGIQSWEDLASKDVEIINPNPATSGGARWNIMAAYGSQLTKGASEQASLDFVKQIIDKTSVQDDSARDSLATFQGGKGDVLIGYENEALQAQEEGVELEYVIPDDTILIENPAAVTVDSDPAAASFLEFAQSTEGQELFAEAGYRPVDPAVLEQNADKFPEPANLFTIDEFGGWSVVADQFFDEEKGSVFAIQRELGNPTE